MVNRSRVEWSAIGAFVAATAGVVALVAIILFFDVGQPFGTLNDLALLVLTLALAPVMLAHYELGGVVPLWPARLSLAGALAAVAAWTLVQVAMIVGQVTFDYDHAATGAYAAWCALQLVIGLWIAGASLLAGPWLPPLVRAMGTLAGLGTIALGAGLLLGGMTHTLTYIGGLGYEIVLPAWAFLLGRVFRQRARR